MVLGKTTVDNSVRDIPKSEQTKEKENEPKKKLLVRFLVNKTKKVHRTIKNSL